MRKKCNEYIVNIGEKKDVERIMPQKEATSKSKIDEDYKNGILSEREKIRNYISIVNGFELPDKYKSAKKEVCGTPLIEEVKKYLKKNPSDIELNTYFLQSETPGISADLSDLDECYETTHFSIYYTLSGASLNVIQSGTGDSDFDGYPDKIEQIGTYVEAIYGTTTGTYGYDEPLVHPDNDRINIYIGKIGYGGFVDGIYDYTLTLPYTKVEDIYMSVDLTALDQDSNFKATFAHELFHCVLAAYNDSSFDWFYEAAATYWGNFIEDSSNYYYSYIADFLNYPTTSLTSDENLHAYGSVLFIWHLVDEFTGGDILQEIVEELGTLNLAGDSIDAINTVLEDNYSTSLEDAFEEFVPKNYKCTTQVYSDFSTQWSATEALKELHTSYPQYSEEYEIPYLSSEYHVFYPSGISECSI